MCQFFSTVSDGKGNMYYFDYEIRKRIINGELNYETDSHSSIIEYFFGKQSQVAYFKSGDKELQYNKYEYNPLTKEFIIDTINVEDDSRIIKEKCINLDFKTIVPELQIKEIINPKNIIHNDNVNESEIALLMMWDSVRDSVKNSVKNSVWDSVWDSVGDSVCNSVCNSVRNSVSNSVWNSVRDSVCNSVWNSVWDSVWNSVWDLVGDSVRYSVRDSVWGYISSFFIIANWKYIEHEEGKNPFQSIIDLWNLGLIPSFDDKTWRLHKMCDNAKVIYEWIKE